MDNGHIYTGLLTFFFLGTAWMLWPFLGAILFGILTAYILHHLEKQLYDHIGNRVASNIIILGILTILLTGLLYGISSSVSALTRNIEAFLTTISGSASFIITVLDLPSSLSNVIDSIVADVSSIIRSTLLNELRRVPNVVIDVTLYVMTVYYFYREGKTTRNRVYELIHELEGRTQDVTLSIARSLNDLAQGVFLNRLLLAISGTLLAGIGFFLMGIEFWWGWALLTGITSFLPLFHEAIVYVPVGGLYMSLGDFWLGVVIIVYGILVLNTLPQLFIRPHLDISRSDEPETLLFLGFIAGIIVFGLKGIILGPIVLVLTKDFFNDIFSRDVEHV